MAVELGRTSLDRLTHVAVREEARVVLHEVPGLSGSFSQILGRNSVTVSLAGIFYGPGAAEDLDTLRAVYLERKPVDFFADTVGVGYFAQVLIRRLEVQQRAGSLDELDYVCELVEYVAPPEPLPIRGLEGLDVGILDEAASVMDDVQDALAAVSDLAETLSRFPDFANPTQRLTELPKEYVSLVSGSELKALTRLKGLF